MAKHLSTKYIDYCVGWRSKIKRRHRGVAVKATWSQTYLCRANAAVLFLLKRRRSGLGSFDELELALAAVEAR